MTSEKSTDEADIKRLHNNAALSRRRSRVRVSSPPFFLKELSDVTPKTPTYNSTHSF